MDAPDPKRLEYASHDNRRPPRLEVRIGGWIVLAVFVALALKELWPWLARHRP